MRMVTSLPAMQRLARHWRQRGVRVGLVPTMGYLHQGHLSLVRAARRRVGPEGKVVVSIYVNPTQFDPKEDLSRYPRDLKRDLRLCRAEGVDVVFVPGDVEMYPGADGTGVPPVRSQKKHSAAKPQANRSATGPRSQRVGSLELVGESWRRTASGGAAGGDHPRSESFAAREDAEVLQCIGETPVPLDYSTYIVEEELSQGMEGASRPTHFRGVTTVVAKLFNLVLPDVAVFGAKDFQQAAVVQRMARDLNFPVKIVVAPTVREPDGVAMSSRNKYLTGELRPQATVLWRSLQLARNLVATARQPVPASGLKARITRLLEGCPDARLDYVEFFDPETLSPVTKVRRGTQMALAVFVGKTRLIDNARL